MASKLVEVEDMESIRDDLDVEVESWGDEDNTLIVSFEGFIEGIGEVHTDDIDYDDLPEWAQERVNSWMEAGHELADARMAERRAYDW